MAFAATAYHRRLRHKVVVMTNSLGCELGRLSTMKPAELRSRWREVYRNVAPDIGPDLLRRGIAYRLQERGQGSLTSSTRRDIERQIKRLGKDDEGAAKAWNPSGALVAWENTSGTCS